MTEPSAVSVKLVGDASSEPSAQLLDYLYESRIQISDSADYLLYINEDHLALAATSDKKTIVRVDFNDSKTRWRQAQSELLHRAIGISEQRKPRVLDATAGMGQDAFALASRGCEVTMVEQHPLIHLLLKDGLRRSKGTDNADVTDRLTLLHADAKKFLRQSNETFDVIYLDPMFPEKRGSAKTKKAMQLLRQMLTDDVDDVELLEGAIAQAKHRVVIKRPIKAPEFAGRKPGYTLKGRNVRYDIFGIKAY